MKERKRSGRLRLFHFIGKRPYEIKDAPTHFQWNRAAAYENRCRLTY